MTVMSDLAALLALYTSTNGSAWKHRTGWLANDSPCQPPWSGLSCIDGRLDRIDLSASLLHGTLPTEIGLLGGVRGSVSFAYNFISGTIPTQIGDLWTLQQSFVLSYNSFSGTIPSQVGRLTNLTMELSLRSPNAHGTIPSELGKLSALSVLDLSFTPLNGTLPLQLGRLTQLQNLVLNDMSLEYPTTPYGSLQLDVSTAACGLTTVCPGLPPQSCSAFANPNLRPVLAYAARSCVDCSGHLWPYVLLFALLALLLVLSIFAFVRLALIQGTSPGVFARWGGTFSMLISHVQTIGLIGSLDLAWPPLVKTLMAYLSFDASARGLKPATLVSHLSLLLAISD